MKRMLISAMCTAAFTAVAQAQGLTGTWQGTTKHGSQIELQLSVSGARLTGTIAVNGQVSNLREGKVTKQSFYFKATIDGQEEAFTGALSTGHLKLWPDRQGPTNAVILQRVKARPQGRSRPDELAHSGSARSVTISASC